ncbi:MAG TPA: AraC family transcriptional regulator [Verrucomicrobiae bacterium]
MPKSRIASEMVEPAFFSAAVAAARRFYLDLKPAPHLPLAVVCGGVEHCTPDYSVHRGTFPYYSIEYVARGNGQLLLGGKSHALEPGTIFSYGPGIPQDITGEREAPLVKYFADFAGREAVRLLKSCQLAPGRVARVYPANTLAPLFDELIRSGLSPGRRNAKLCAKLLECLALKIAGATAPLEGMETLAFTTYQQCRRHIERHFLRLRTLRQIADECHTNNAYLCRLFRRYDQQTPYQYLLSLKMNHAAERLESPGVLVKQVAEETAFPDPFHFSRVFKNVLGISPDSFRKLR